MSKMILLCVILGLFTTTVSGQLEATAPDSFEGPCWTVDPVQDIGPLLPFMMETSVFGIYFSSKADARVYVETYLGRPARDQEEIEKLCLNIIFSLEFFVQRGFGNKTFINKGIPLDVLGTFNVSTHFAHIPGVDPFVHQRTIHETLAWSDGENHALLVRCLNNKLMDWKVISLIPPSEEVKQTVLDLVVSFGFKRENALDLTDAWKRNCPPLQPLKDFASQILNDFENSRALDSSSDFNDLKRELETPITLNDQTFSNLHSLFTSMAAGAK